MSKKRSMATWLLTWNPDKSDLDLSVKKELPTDWSCGNTIAIQKRDSFYFVRQGVEPKGIVGSGVITESPFYDRKTLYVGIRFLQVLDPDVDDILSREYLKRKLPGVRWDTQISGIRVPDHLAPRVEKVWSAYLSGKAPGAVPRVKFLEGKLRQVQLNVYERDPQARRACIAKHGYRCSVCAMSFKKVYGDLGKDFIHVHHLNPLGGRGAGRPRKVDPVRDLRPVCPNCHAMLHRGKEPLTIKKLRKIVKQMRPLTS